jgi:plasmid stability protein
MGIVKISDQMHENLRIASTALNRSINAQAEHWLRIGLLAETNPELRYSDICQMLLRTVSDGNLTLADAMTGGTHV